MLALRAESQRNERLSAEDTCEFERIDRQTIVRMDKNKDSRYAGLHATYLNRFKNFVVFKMKLFTRRSVFGNGIGGIIWKLSGTSSMAKSFYS